MAPAIPPPIEADITLKPKMYRAKSSGTRTPKVSKMYRLMVFGIPHLKASLYQPFKFSRSRAFSGSVTFVSRRSLSASL